MTSSRARRLRMLFLVMALSAGLLGSSAGASIRPAGPTALAQAAMQPGWSVEPTAPGEDRAGWRVTWRPGHQLAVRSLPGEITSDGRVLGTAALAPDLQSVSAVTSDPDLVKAGSRFALTYGGAEYVAPIEVEQAPTDQRIATTARSGPVLDVDPGRRGPYEVREDTYNLGARAVQLPGLPKPAELAGAVYWPAGASGRLPVVVFLHGSHVACYRGEEGYGGWPCPDGFKAFPSALGYGKPARVLASHGYIVISIAANGVNGQEGTLLDHGMNARGHMVLEHLSRWRQWNRGASGPFGDRFVGRLDLGNVGLMGHSRGGEGVVRAAILNSQREHPFGIRAVMPLAPTDFNRLTLPGMPMSVVLPYCDGDVFGLDGQQLFDDARGALAGDPAARSTVLLMGANHNYFNTQWSPRTAVSGGTDDWWGSYGGMNKVCDPTLERRLTATEQRAAGTAYIAGFFRLQLGRERALLGLFDGSGARAESAGRADARVVAQSPKRRMIARLDRPTGAVTASGVSASWCRGAEFGWPPHRGALPPCAEASDPSATPHWRYARSMPLTPTMSALTLQWTRQAGAVTVDVPRSQRDLSAMKTLTFRAGVDPAAGATDLKVQVVDRNGNSAAVRVSDVSRALRPLPGKDAMLPRRLLQQVSIPLSRLRGVDTRHVAAVRFVPAAATGRVWLTDLLAQRPAIGSAAPSLRGLTIDNVRLLEGDSGPRAARLTIRADAASQRTMSAFAQATIAVVDRTGGTVEFYPYRNFKRRVTLAPGQTSAVVDVPLDANTRDDDKLVFVMSLTRTRQAVARRMMGRVTVVDDDPTPTVTVSDATATEGSLMEFTLTLSKPSGRLVFVRGMIEGGTATAGSDYPDIPAFDGGIEPGQKTGTMMLDMFDDAVDEPDETLIIRPAATAARYTGPELVTGTILDND